jgi:predicted GNAT family acetyltransferase
VENHLAVLEYELEGEIITFTHTGVPTELGGRGLGGQLVRAGLDYARENRLKVIPQCSFVAGYLGKHPEDQDLVQG